ncbi:TIGR01212 family radical SAM protein [Blautia sp. HCP3S3_G3]|uniref:TIGR01212 family radical SAM protein n=1 Tax=Blautia sp. HCP3S3_G3 TaxID=3438913 RepID=UPI003F89B485
MHQAPEYPYENPAGSCPVRWNEKPYHSLDFMLRERFGEKVYKVTLNGGMTCPNRDGKIGRRGCIFCSAGGSGDFAADASLSITEQINSQIALLSAKRPIRKYIAYFQAYTNTYAPVDYLRKIFTEALRHPSIVALSIGTRPDCLGPDVLALLDSLSREKPVWVELGLQTIHEKTAQYIRRGYPLSCFEQAVRNLRARHLDVIVHTILGLPGENSQDMLATMDYLNHMDIQGIKLQLLHVLAGTDLAEEYARGVFQVLDRDDYLDLLIDCLEHLDPSIVIHRMTGDGPSDLLIAPLWASRKREVLNLVHHRMKERGSFQGKALQKRR